jgi:hypothetical protein
MYVSNDAPKCLKEVVKKIQSCGLHALVQISNLTRWPNCSWVHGFMALNILLNLQNICKNYYGHPNFFMCNV